MIRSRKMRWAGRIACMRERRDALGTLVGKPSGRRHSEETGLGR